MFNVISFIIGIMIGLGLGFVASSPISLILYGIILRIFSNQKCQFSRNIRITLFPVLGCLILAAIIAVITLIIKIEPFGYNPDSYCRVGGCIGFSVTSISGFSWLVGHDKR